MANDTDFYWDLAAEFMARDDVEEGTLMGFPCLRVGGEFFSTCEHRSGDLIVKLPRSRVDELIGQGVGQPFAPAGKVFREWVLVRERDEELWSGLMKEAHGFNSADGPG